MKCCKTPSFPVSKAYCLILVFFSLLAMRSAFGETKTSRPNLVFILADDLGYGEVGYHAGWHRRIMTPFIDKLASSGVRLENYYVEPICSPTRVQFMSGRSQIHTGLQHKNISPMQPSGLPLDSPTLADKLKEAGYSTHMIGKWHLGFYKKEYLPTSRGFDSFYGMYLGSGDHYTHRSHCRRCAIDLHDDKPSKLRDVSDKSGVYSTHLYTNKAVEIISKHNTEKPLFMFLSYQAVHGPLQVPRKYVKIMKKRFRNKRKGGKHTKAAMTLAMDYGIGKVYRALKRKGLWNNTVLIFSNDNGAPKKFGGINLPLRGYKGSYYEGGIRGVGFVNSPLLKHKGYINNELLHVTDWFPTLVRLANGTLDGTSDVNGFDQWDVISKKEATKRQEILHNIDPKAKSKLPSYFNNTFDTRWKAALRHGDFKLITGLKQSPGFQLFNIRHDPLEERDLALTNPLKVRAMLDMLQEHQSTAVPVHFPRRDRVKMGRFWGPWK